MKALLRGLLSNHGQGMTEYGLILAVFVLTVFVAAVLLGPKVVALYTNTNSLFD